MLVQVLNLEHMCFPQNREHAVIQPPPGLECIQPSRGRDCLRSLERTIPTENSLATLGDAADAACTTMDSLPDLDIEPDSSSEGEAQIASSCPHIFNVIQKWDSDAGSKCILKQSAKPCRVRNKRLEASCNLVSSCVKSAGVSQTECPGSVRISSSAVANNSGEAVFCCGDEADNFFPSVWQGVLLENSNTGQMQMKLIECGHLFEQLEHQVQSSAAASNIKPINDGFVRFSF